MDLNSLSLKESINEFLDIPVEKWKRETDLGTQLSFEPIVSSLGNLYEFLEVAKSTDFSKIPSDFIHEPIRIMHDLISKYSEIQNFRIDFPDVVQRRANLIREIQNLVSGLYRSLNVAIGVSLTLDRSKLRVEEERLQQLREEASNILDSTRIAQSEIKKLTAASQNLASKRGVEQYRRLFHSVSFWQGLLGWFWTLVTIAILTIVSLFAYKLLIDASAPPAWVPHRIDGKVYLYHIIFSKLLLLSISSFALVFVTRNAKAAFHNHVVNAHRAKALDTLDVLVGSVEDPELRKILFSQMANCIVGFRASGYIHTEPDGDSNHSSINMLKLDSFQK